MCAALHPRNSWAILKNADYVITNSFHGTVFSVIFKRRFLSDTDVIKEGKPGKNERSQQLLEALSPYTEDFNGLKPISMRQPTGRQSSGS